MFSVPFQYLNTSSEIISGNICLHISTSLQICDAAHPGDADISFFSPNFIITYRLNSLPHFRLSCYVLRGNLRQCRGPGLRPVTEHERLRLIQPTNVHIAKLNPLASPRRDPSMETGGGRCTPDVLQGCSHGDVSVITRQPGKQCVTQTQGGPDRLKTLRGGGEGVGGL